MPTSSFDTYMRKAAKYNRYANTSKSIYRNLYALKGELAKFGGSRPKLRGSATKQYSPQYKQVVFLRNLHSRTDLGNPARATTCKRSAAPLVNEAAAGYELYSWPLVYINQGQSSTSRLRNVANVRGVKLEMTVQTELLRNLNCLNVACVIPKPGFSGFANLTKTDFWRSPSPSNQEGYGRNFTATQSHLEYDTLGINSTAYRILWRKKFSLAPLEQYGDFVNPESSIQIKGSQCVISEWIKIDKQMVWENQNASEPQNNVWVVYWMSKFGDPQDGQRTATPGFASVQMRRETFFKEPGDF